MKTTDESLVILGNGPAGMLAGSELRGMDPLIIAPSRKPTPSVCGGVLTAPSTAFLRRRELLEPLARKAGRWLDGVRIHAGGKQLLKHQIEPGRMIAFRRKQFDRQLWQQLDIAEIRTNVDYVRDVHEHEGHLRLNLRSEDSLTAEGIIDGSGHRQLTGGDSQQPETLVGIEWSPEVALSHDHSLHLVLGSGWYAGVSSPPGDSITVSAVARQDHFQKLEPTGLWKKISSGLSHPVAHRLPDSAPDNPLTKAGFWNGPSRDGPKPRVIRVGDALGFTMPLTGEGIAMAMMEGYRAGGIIGEDRRGAGDLFPLTNRARERLQEELIRPYRRQIPRWKRTHWFGSHGPLVKFIGQWAPWILEWLLETHLPSESHW